ncbi:MAG: zf-HC2 domain-containing protein [Candidatus Sabulitectum sp.]|nr:zf-HC2 domain-containing protein [Candidatus Sabulitectum sp.]
MKCNEALFLMDSLLDGEATPEEEQMLRFHINGCPSCRKTMLLNRSIGENMKNLEEPDPPADLMDMVLQRLASGDYDKSPMADSNRFKLPAWRIAAAIPFAAALVLILQNFTGENPSDYGNNTIETATLEETVTQYAPAPVVAYSRPSSVSTF